MWQHVVSPCWSPVHKSLEISDGLARLFLVIQRRNHTLTARHVMEKGMRNAELSNYFCSYHKLAPLQVQSHDTTRKKNYFLCCRILSLAMLP